MCMNDRKESFIEHTSEVTSTDVEHEKTAHHLPFPTLTLVNRRTGVDAKVVHERVEGWREGWDLVNLGKGHSLHHG